jgi:hypothetical protein
VEQVSATILSGSIALSTINIGDAARRRKTTRISMLAPALPGTTLEPGDRFEVFLSSDGQNLGLPESFRELDLSVDELLDPHGTPKARHAERLGTLEHEEQLRTAELRQKKPIGRRSALAATAADRTAEAAVDSAFVGERSRPGSVGSGLGPVNGDHRSGDMSALWPAELLIRAEQDRPGRL